MTVLLCGGAGYIGSHTALYLLENGCDVVVLDNLSNASDEALKRVEKLTGKKVPLIVGDCTVADDVQKAFDSYKIDSVIHFAGKKAVGESCAIPLEYYRNNLGATMTICEVMRKNNCFTLIFSSSATVYSTSPVIPYIETAQLGCTNPYGWTKFMSEQMLRDLYASDPRWKIVLLRYFNPVGAHESGDIGEDPTGIPNNLMPYICRVAAGRLEKLHVFGNDYDTPDGTGVRDYLHVMDLARGHLSALRYALDHPGAEAVNLGTGVGYSVLDIVRAFEEANRIKIPYVIEGRRPGDIATCYADASKAKNLLGWEAQFGIKDMCRDAWNWQKKNPDGYRK